MLRRRFLWLIALAAVFPLAVWGFDRAQKIYWVGFVDLEIEFVVSDAHTGQPIEAAEILVDSEGGFYRDRDEKQFKLVTDRNGIAKRICYDSMCSGTQSGLRFTDTFAVHLPWWYVQVSAPGYELGEPVFLDTSERAQQAQKVGPGLAKLVVPLSVQQPAPLDLLIRNGTVYDGSGKAPRRADVGVRGDKIVAVGDLGEAAAKTVIDAKGLAVAPGFINMLSWSNESLLADGKGQSEIRQGVTTQIMGEGWSMGPLSDAIKKRMKAEQGDFRYEIEWTALSEYLYWLQRQGVSHNVASFIGATTIREHVLGLENRKPTAAELDRMRQLVEREMKDGALGIATALVYPPATYSDTDELIELCKVAAKYKGKYISHMRSEGTALLEGIDEVIRISREARLPAEIYHFKALGKPNWGKMDAAVAKVEAARKEGLAITANMYCYTAGATGLTACVPPWAHEGGQRELRRRIQDPALRPKIIEEIRSKTEGWENFYLGAGSPDRILLVGFKQERLKPLQGKTLADVAKERKKDPVETLLDLLVEDESRIDTVYFMMSEENVRKLIPLPWMSFGSDEASQAPGGVFLKSMPHPRAYGNFARLLGKYVRDEKLLPLEEAIRKCTSLPATNLGLDRRGLLKEDYFADIVIFDPQTIADRATFEKPHQYAVGVQHVFVNGVQVLKDGEHTGAKPGKALWGPGRAAPARNPRE